jgi:hypothetical protein
MPKHIVPRLQIARHRDRPLIPLTNQILARPRLCRVINPRLRDLDPLQRRLVGLGTPAAGARGDVGQDRPVGVRPRVGAPTEDERAARLDRRGEGAGRRVLVAVDVRGGVGVGGDEAFVEVFGVPVKGVDGLAGLDSFDGERAYHQGLPG